MGFEHIDPRDVQGIFRLDKSCHSILLVRNKTLMLLEFSNWHLPNLDLCSNKEHEIYDIKEKITLPSTTPPVESEKNPILRLGKKKFRAVEKFYRKFKCLHNVWLLL